MIRTFFHTLVLIFALSVSAVAGEKFITLASTTSTQNSGLFNAILPVFKAKTGISVRVIAVGTGQALRIARNGDADALLVHHRASEDAFVAQGYGITRKDVMYNDFILVGPGDDPAKIAASTTITQALTTIAQSNALFASRGDDSGTHRKERELWAKTGISPTGHWYLETGSGMGATLNLATIKNAYVLTDRGTWITFGNKGNLKRLYSGDLALFNPYGVILVNPSRHPHVKTDLARQFADWIVSVEGQQAISSFRIAGSQAFCPNAMNIPATVKNRAACPADTN